MERLGRISTVCQVQTSCPVGLGRVRSKDLTPIGCFLVSVFIFLFMGRIIKELFQHARRSSGISVSYT